MVKLKKHELKKRGRGGAKLNKTFKHWLIFKTRNLLNPTFGLNQKAQFPTNLKFKDENVKNNGDQIW
jgi:hypothetical protein